MNFFECPKYFISEYYDQKINLIDLNCERLILNNQNDEKILKKFE